MDNQKLNYQGQLLKDFKTLFRSVVDFYDAYLERLKDETKLLNDNDDEGLSIISKRIDLVTQNMNHDINVFEKVLDEDLENVNEFSTNLKVNNIKNSLLS